MIKIFEENLRTLKQISIDNHDISNPSFMTESEFLCIDFDSVKDDYVDKLSTIVTPKSIDALILKDNNKTMVEFKNGIVDKKLISSIVDKMLNSVIIYSDITGESVESIRQNMDFILVYNYDKNPFNIKKYKQNYYRDMFVKSLSKKARERYTQFGLFKYEGYIFRAIYTYSKKDFKEEFTDKL